MLEPLAEPGGRFVFKILVSDPLESTGLEMLRDSGHEVFELPAEERGRLAEIIADYDALVVRSATRVTAELLRAGRRLKVVGRAGIGVDNVDVDAATELGILVVNAPTANLIAATEHTFAMLLALARNVPAADDTMKQGRWDRKKFVGTELQGKTLGVIGFGRIGQQVARRAQAFEMTVIAYDPVLDPDSVRRLDVEPMPLAELLPRADVVTLHVPLTDETRGLLNRERIAAMKKGALLVNCARGGVVDEAALLTALDEGRLAGAALDVFAQEPPADYELARHPRVVATPHLGAQTHEAQTRISTETARMVLAALQGSLAITAVNLPFRPAGPAGVPYLRLAEKLGLLAGHQLEGSLKEVQVALWDVDETLHKPIGVAAVKGVLSRYHGDSVNYVNAERVARDRGLKVVRSIHSEAADYPHLVKVRLAVDGAAVEVAGVLFHDRDPRVVELGGYQLEFQPKGRLLLVRNRDVPGVVGKVGTALGDAGVNIAEIHLSRRPGSAEALAVVRLDQDVPAAVLDALRKLPEVKRVDLIDLGKL
jgi:D-3-phosphoglycerate dehydrogenase